MAEYLAEGKTVYSNNLGHGFAFASDEEPTAISLSNSANFTTEGTDGDFRFGFSLPRDSGHWGSGTYFEQQDENPNSENSWNRQWNHSGHFYSLSLWNAGTGTREDLERPVDGQVYHKIIGYYHSGRNFGTHWNSRGHAILGIATPEAAVDARTRQATYSGSFLVNSIARNADTVAGPVKARGDIELTADFDRNTISGRSTSFEVRQDNGSYVAQNHTLTFGETQFESERLGHLYNDGGVPTETGYGYTGQLSSDYEPLTSGTYRGRFFGPNAQETAGAIAASGAVNQSEGFFTAAETN